MSFDEIKKIIKDQNSTFVFIENNKPIFVIMKYEAFEKLKGESVTIDGEGSIKLDEVVHGLALNDFDEDLPEEKSSSKKINVSDLPV